MQKTVGTVFHEPSEPLGSSQDENYNFCIPTLRGHKVKISGANGMDATLSITEQERIDATL